MDQPNRRNFLKTTAGAVLASNLVIRNTATGANDVIRAAVVGVRGRGGSHIAGLEELDGVEVVALCDVDETVLNDRAAKFKEKYGRDVKKYVDYRELLKDSNIDVVSIATPNHSHSIMGIWA